MTIKQHGGVFGRNPAFNDVSVETLSIAGTALASTAAELNILDGVTADATEINYLDGASTSVVTASKAVLANASANIAFASGNGIDFSATGDGSGTMDNELLDDYEEGTWTPQSTISGLTSNTGWYTKVGNKVTAWYEFTVTSSSGSVIRLAGFPFTASSGYQGVITLCGAQSAAAGPFQWNTTPDIRNGSNGVVSHGTLTGSIVYGFFTYQT